MNDFLLKYKYNTEDEQFSFYEHKCGLQLLFVKTNDDNNTFCAQFDTVPNNDNGIPHILEHIILCGSEKYPIDDPFNELVKGTLFTYLNAITYCDKTIYPVSSRNKSEFEKMYKVYLDAVFSPFLSKESFLKEGVRNTDSGHSGIVFNEMSAAYNDIETLISYHITKELFCGTNYEYDSGGNPESIINATHDEVIEFYHKNYSKSNALLYFYGDLDIEKILDYIEDTYLVDEKENTREYKEYRKLDDKIVNKKIFITKERDINYYALAYNIDRDFKNVYHLDELCILFDFLLESDTSLLTKFLKDKYNLIDISYDFETDTMYPHLTIILKAENEIQNAQNIPNEVQEFLESVIKDGLNKEEIESLISLTNFKYIYENFGYKSKGLSYFLDILSFFQYSKERDYIHLSKKLDFGKLIDKNQKKHFENLLNDSIISCRNRIFIEFSQNDTNSKPSNFKNSEEFVYESILEYSDKFIQPINLNEIEPFKELDFVKTKLSGRDVYFTEHENNQISFITLAFEINGDFDGLGVFLELVGESGTAKSSKREIKIKQDKYIGDMSVSFESISTRNDNNDNYVIFELKFLNKYTEEVFATIEEVLNYSNYSDVDMNRAKIDELILDFDEDLISDNVRIGLLYANRDINEMFYYKDLVEGFGFYDSLTKYKREQNYDFSKFNGVKYFSDLTVFVCAYEYDSTAPKLNNFLDKIETSYIERVKPKIVLPKNKKIITTNSQTFTNIKVGCVDNMPYRGVCEVFSSIVKNELFSDEIRLKGGAYGYDISFDYDMNFYMYSIDDPNSDRTQEVFEKASDYVLNKSFNDKEIHNHIIGTINSFDNFRSFYDKYYLFVLSILKNDETHFYSRLKESILCANEDNIKEFASKFNENVTKCNTLTIGEKY